jgi:hypothetical protein
LQSNRNNLGQPIKIFDEIWAGNRQDKDNKYLKKQVRKYRRNAGKSTTTHT